MQLLFRRTGAVPVSGDFPAGGTLTPLEIRMQAIQL